MIYYDEDKELKDNSFNWIDISGKEIPNKIQFTRGGREYNSQHGILEDEMKQL